MAITLIVKLLRVKKKKANERVDHQHYQRIILHQLNQESLIQVPHQQQKTQITIQFQRIVCGALSMWKHNQNGSS